MRPHLLVSAVTLALLPACQFGPAIERVIEDPSRLCPSGQQLVVDEAGKVVCVPRPAPTVEPTSTPTAQPTRTPVCCDPTPTPVITATATPTPTVATTPTPEPVKPEVCARGEERSIGLTTDQAWAPPKVPVPPLTDKPCPWPLVRRDHEAFGRLHHCSLNPTCAGVNEKPTLHDNPVFSGAHEITGPDHPCGPGYVVTRGHPELGCGDAYGQRTFDGKTVDPYIWDGKEETPFVTMRCVPKACPDVVPTPVPTTGTPVPTPGTTPTPFYPPRQPDDFRLNFINGPNHLRYPRLLNGDQDVRGQADTTPRYIGTLKNGKRHGNACDPDHYQCAEVACPNITPDEYQAHRDTFELCAGRWWDSAAGSRLETNPPIRVERDDENPYQHWMTAPRGMTVQVRACPAELPVVTTDGLTVPTGGDGCGAWKPVHFEVN